MPLRGVASAPVALLLAVGCGETTAPVAPPCDPPLIRSSSVAANPVNVLSAIITVDVAGADSVTVHFSAAGTLLSEATPATAVASGTESLQLPVLALRENRTYDFRVTAFGCAAVVSEPSTLTTGTLPPDLPSFAASGSDPSPGYVVFASANYGLAIDNSGKVVWYHRFANGAGLNFQPQPNGRYVGRPARPAGEQPRWVEIDPLGSAMRELHCARGLQARLHDVISLPDGSYWLMCDEIRSIDLSQQGRAADARVLGTVVQRVAASGELLFEWSAFDHIPVELRALDMADLTGPSINWTHGNAIDLDLDGNLLLSLRNLSQVLKIDTRTGAVLWRMGGPGNQFQLESAGNSPFLRQHSVRASGRNAFLVLDNLGESDGSRAERFEYDEGEKTARLIKAYRSSAGVIAHIGGSVQELPGGRVLVSFGNGGAVEEFDAAGNVVWRIEGNPGYVFRAQRVRSLYRPGVAETR